MFNRKHKLMLVCILQWKFNFRKSERVIKRAKERQERKKLQKTKCKRAKEQRAKSERAKSEERKSKFPNLLPGIMLHFSY